MVKKVLISLVPLIALTATAVLLPDTAVSSYLRSSAEAVDETTQIENAIVNMEEEDSVGVAEEAVGFEKWYRNSLSQEERKIYDALDAGIHDLSEDIEVPECDRAALEKCFMFVLYDNPDIFWVGTNYKYMSKDGVIFSVQPAYETTDKDFIAKRAAEMDRIATDAANSVRDIQDPYEKATAIYQWISDYCVYDADAPDNQDIESFFINKVSACAGYSRAYQIIAGKVGIPCLYVTGPAKANDKVEHHAWNAINLAGVNTYMDVTWGDRDGEAPTDYSWFGLTLPDISKTHTADYPDLVPSADDPVYEYWTRNGGNFDSYDKVAVFEFLKSKIEAGEETASVRFSTEEAMDECHADYTKNTGNAEGFVEAFPGKFSDPEGSGVYSIYKQEGLNSVVFVWKY